MRNAAPKVVVIGGGITGLTASYRLHRAAHEGHLPLQVTLLEASDHLGGIIATSQKDGLLIEHGPDSFITTKPAGVQLCEELELSDELIGTTTQHRRSFIVRKGKLRPVPQGLYLMAPGSLWPFATSSILSWRGKLRMGLDLVLPRRPASDDESLAQFVTRRLGREALERVAQPMVGGIYTADPELLSLQATMPHFLEMERRHGSLIRAMRHQQRMAKQPGASGARYGLFVSFRRGMQTLVQRLAANLPPDAIRLHTRVHGLTRIQETSRWRVQLQNQPDLEADAICLALPAPLASPLLTPIDTALASELQIPYASSAIINLAFRRQDIAHALDGMGFVVPAVENRSIIACSFSSIKFAGRAPGGQVLLRAFVGGALQHAQYDRSDAEIQDAVYRDLRDLLGVTGDPLHIRISRWPQSMAQYHLGHVDRVARIESLLSRLPGLALAGNAYHGVGIPDCIRSGNSAAQALLAHFGLAAQGE
ncbi:MAG: protoporphyrinogen oxidase [Candidatus Tectomicrobia bacterium]|nr:protoporphyrinogen oxidase [Candidatus Tectomicrobia bacterium]